LEMLKQFASFDHQRGREILGRMEWLPFALLSEAFKLDC
jgi:hypothetical protein